MAENMPAPLRAQLMLLEGWSGEVRNYLAQFVKSNEDIPFIEDILSDCDAYGIAIEEVIRVGLALGDSKQQAELFFNIINLMTTSFNVGRHQGTIEHVDFCADPESKKALKKHLEEAREAFTPVTTIKFEVVRDKTKSLWERQSEYVGNIRGTALTIAKVANAEIQRRCGLLDTGARAGAPEGDLSLSAMMKWVRRAQAALIADGQFARL